VRSDDDRSAKLATPSAAERLSALREVMAQEEPNLRRGVAVLVWQYGRTTQRDEVAAIADDVLQEAFSRALDRAETFDPSRSGHAWLFGFAINVVREQRRSMQTEQAHIIQRAPDADTSTPGTMTPSEAALQRLHDAESAREYRVIELLDLVPPPQREVLRQRYVHNLRGRELAAALGGISEGAARVRVSRAKKSLAEAYAEAEGWPMRNGEGG
jgi:RNA polymerase sigma factor (sigma-70 family)